MADVCNIKSDNNIILVFTDFLNRHKIKEKFLNNLENNCLETLAEPKEWINFAFDWADTVEGYTFWLDKHKKWINELTRAKEVKLGDLYEATK